MNNLLQNEYKPPTNHEGTQKKEEKAGESSTSSPTYEGTSFGLTLSSNLLEGGVIKSVVHSVVLAEEVCMWVQQLLFYRHNDTYSICPKKCLTFKLKARFLLNY